MAAAKKKAAVIDEDELVARARASVESDGFVKLTALGPPAVRKRIAEQLAALGFELSKSVVRKPLAEQLLEALADGAFIPLKSLGSFVRGATAAEAKNVVAELVTAGRGALVLRGSAEVLVAAGTPVYDRAELTEMRRALGAVEKLCAKVLKQRATTLLRADIREIMAALFPELGRTQSPKPPSVGSSKAQANPTLAKIFDALDASRDDTLGLSFIPKMMERLGPELGLEAARTGLLNAAEQGLVELRPEGGLNRLTHEELELCLPGPQGTRLSWARRVEARTP